MFLVSGLGVIVSVLTVTFTLFAVMMIGAAVISAGSWFFRRR